MHRVPHGAGGKPGNDVISTPRKTRAEAATSFTIVRCRSGADEGSATS